MKIVSLTGIAGLVYPRRLISSLVPEDPSRVIIVEDGTSTSGYSINEDAVRTMMDTGIEALTYLPDIGEAWKTLFPGIGPSSVIAIKVNCLNPALPTHPEVTNAVVGGLKQMVVGDTPFSENNIIIFDSTNTKLQESGYTLNTSGTGVRCFGTYSSGVGYSDEYYDVNGIPQKISRIVTEMADYLIDISVLKNHETAGVTLCLKNNFGTCESPESLHGNFCDPYIPALNSIPPILDKQVLNICDALLGVYSGGPLGDPQFAANKIIISRDIVAVDYQGREILKNNGSMTIPRSLHIDTAAQAPYNLGTNDPIEMDIVYITDPTTGTEDPGGSIGREDILFQQNHPNPFNDSTQIRFCLSRPEHVEMVIYDVAGRRVRKLVSTTVGFGWHRVNWDGRNDSGRHVSSGIYFCQLVTGSYRKAIIMQVLK